MTIIISILLMIGTTYLIRTIPLTLFRKPVKSKFIKSFLYYVPYVTLACMTVPAIIYETGNKLIGLCALIAGIIGAYFDLGLLKVAIICCLTVLVLMLLI